MHTITHFEKSLCASARLFSLSKAQADLFLILQTNTMTYQQLSLGNIHGNTEASGRLSLKRLERSGLVQAKTLPAPCQTKYYFLTQKGRSQLKEFLPTSFSERMQINWERRPPSGAQQIQHRIRTNDFYFSYLGAPMSQPLPWILEHPIGGRPTAGQKQGPRCDGLLISPHAKYFIEQDNSTQSEAVLSLKIQQYLQNGFFSSASLKDTLVFCLAFPRKKPSSAKPSFSLYRVLLRFSKIWGLLEEEYRMQLDYQQVMQALKSSPLRSVLSQRDAMALDNLHALHSEMETFAGITALKKTYLGDRGYFELQDRERDALFQKRLKSHFSRLHSKHPDLLAHSLAGAPLFAVPNHRLEQCQAYIMPSEYGLKDALLQSLLHSGLNTDGWIWRRPLEIRREGAPSLFFCQGFQHRHYGYIAVEHMAIDLNARCRVLYYVKNCSQRDQRLILLAVTCGDGGENIFRQFATAAAPSAWKRTTLLQMDSNLQRPAQIFFAEDGERTPVLLECDAFDEELRILKKGV